MMFKIGRCGPSEDAINNDISIKNQIIHKLQFKIMFNAPSVALVCSLIGYAFAITNAATANNHRHVRGAEYKGVHDEEKGKIMMAVRPTQCCGIPIISRYDI